MILIVRREEKTREEKTKYIIEEQVLLGMGNEIRYVIQRWDIPHYEVPQLVLLRAYFHSVPLLLLGLSHSHHLVTCREILYINTIQIIVHKYKVRWFGHPIIKKKYK